MSFFSSPFSFLLFPALSSGENAAHPLDAKTSELASEVLWLAIQLHHVLSYLAHMLVSYIFLLLNFGLELVTCFGHEDLGNTTKTRNVLEHSSWPLVF